MLRTVRSILSVSAAVVLGASGSVATASSMAPSTTTQRVPLTQIYRGDDGGALYLRQLGSKVYGFGEHPGLERPYAYVLVGDVSGDRITGSWWDVPKGVLRRVNRGSLDLQWSQGGARVVRKGGADFGPDVLTAIPPDGIPWPGMTAARFQATTTGDLDGAFVGDDGSRHYVRETSFNTFWVAERASQPGERPGWVTVFAGKRTSGGGFAGTYVDVPKGLERASGNFGAALIGSKRELFLKQNGVERTKSLVPEYAVDWGRFASEVAKEVADRVVGYAVALAHNGAIVGSGAWGVRRHAIDGGALPFTTKTQAQTASAAKLVSATAIVKALQARGLDVDTKIAPFLPSCIETGPGVASITFREILNHKAGLRGARDFEPKGRDESCNGRDPYECLLDVLAQGRKFPRAYGYNNKAYDLLRFLVPLVSNTTAAKADFEQFDCRNKAGVLHRRIAERFARYVLDEVLKPVGSNGTWYPSGDFALNYNCNAQLQEVRCNVIRKGEAMTKDYFLRSGSGKMAMSALDYVRFLGALDRGLIVPNSAVESMKQGRLGFDSSISGRAGEYYWKNGKCPSLDRPEWGRGCKTLAMTFPGDVQAYITVNSFGNSYTPNLEPIFRNAFDAALR